MRPLGTKVHCDFEASRPSDTDRFLSPTLPRVPQPPQASPLRSHTVAETAEDPPARALSVGSPASLAAESEDEDSCPLGAHDKFLDTSPILCVSAGVVVPPHIERGAGQVIFALSTEILDPRRTLRQVLEDVTQGRWDIDCVCDLQRFVDSMMDYKSQSEQGCDTTGAYLQPADPRGSANCC